MPRSLSLASHTASSLSVLGRPGRCSGVAGVDQPHHQAAGFQQVHERPPGVGGGRDHDTLDPLAGQLLGQLDDGAGGGRYLPYLGGALARLGWCGTRVHTIPDALATSIAATCATISSGASTSAMSPSWATSLPPAIVGVGSGLTGSPVGNRNSDRRAQGNSARPCCRAPAPDCITASTDQGCIGVGGQPGPFSHLRGVPPGYLD